MGLPNIIDDIETNRLTIEDVRETCEEEQVILKDDIISALKTVLENDSVVPIGTTEVENIMSVITDIQNELNSITSKVIETYKSGNNWYRKYSDGWKECGGRFTTSGTSCTITFPISFSNTTYTLVCQEMETSATDTDGVDFNILASNLTTTSARFSKANVRQIMYYVCGY